MNVSAGLKSAESERKVRYNKKKCLISWLLDIWGKDGLHFEIEFHHFLFSRFTINQQIQENLMVREYHKLPHGPPSPVLPLEPPQQKVRGPAGGGEEGSQCDDPTQQQVLTGGPAGWDPPQFSSTDVRERVQQEKLSPSSLVTLFTRYCHQKPGGGFTLPKIAASDFCPFCNQGNTCLGQFCKGETSWEEKSCQNSDHTEHPHSWSWRQQSSFLLCPLQLFSYFNYKEENLCSQSKFSNIQT